MPTVMGFEYPSIYVMENNTKTQMAYSRVCSKFNIRLVPVDSKEQAEEEAKQNTLRYCILDIDMGDDREQEGLDTLEILKKHDKNIFVGLISAYPNRYHRMARRLKADVFRQKSGEIEEDLLYVLDKILKKKQHDIQRIRERISLQIDLPQHEIDFVDRGLENDINFQAYQEYLKSNDISERFVAFIDGNFVFEHSSRNVVLDFLDNHSGGQQFLGQIPDDDEDDIVDIPTPLEVD